MLLKFLRLSLAFVRIGLSPFFSIAELVNLLLDPDAGLRVRRVARPFAGQVSFDQKQFLKLGPFVDPNDFLGMVVGVLSQVLVVDAIFLQGAEELGDVDAHTVALALAALGCVCDGQPAGHCEVDGLRDVVSSVETRVVSSGPGDDELSGPLDRASQLDALLE